MSTVRETESVLFKPVDGGYVFQAPNPWVFGRTRRYLVNEAQKAAILAIIVPARPVRRVILITLGVLLWTGIAATMMWALSRHENPTATDALAMFVLVLVPIYLAWVAALRRNLRRMAPMLAGAPRTELRITGGERRRAMADAISLQRTLVYAALWSFTAALQAFSLVIRNARHPLFGDVQSFINLFVAVLAAGLAIHYLVIAVRKLRQRPAIAG